jgi:hypothetical protein
MSDKVSWLAEARRYAKHAYCYENMVHDFAEDFDGEGDPYEAVDRLAERFDLERADDKATWGINSHVKFERRWIV